MTNIIKNVLLLGKATIISIILLFIREYSSYIFNKLANRSPLRLSCTTITYYTIITSKGYITRFPTKSPAK